MSHSDFLLPMWRLVAFAAAITILPEVASPAAAAEVQSTGTAFVVDPDGYLVTCAHVVRGATKIKVSLGDKNFEATVLGVDKTHDLAVLRIQAKGLAALPLLDSNLVEVGEEARAFGFPLSAVLGENLKVTRGTISGVTQRESGKVLQIDVAVNAGNSGGPLVAETGVVMGVVNAKLSGLKVSNVAFAVPINYAKTLIHSLGARFAEPESKAKLDGPSLVKQVSPTVALVATTRDLPDGLTTQLPTLPSGEARKPDPLLVAEYKRLIKAADNALRYQEWDAARDYTKKAEALAQSDDDKNDAQRKAREVEDAKQEWEIPEQTLTVSSLGPSHAQVLNRKGNLAGEVSVRLMGGECGIYSSLAPLSLVCFFYPNDPVGQTRVGKSNKDVRITSTLRSMQSANGKIDAVTVSVSVKRLIESGNISVRGARGQPIGAARGTPPLNLDPVVPSARAAPALVASPAAASDASTSSNKITSAEERTVEFKKLIKAAHDAASRSEWDLALDCCKKAEIVAETDLDKISARKEAKEIADHRQEWEIPEQTHSLSLSGPSHAQLLNAKGNPMGEVELGMPVSRAMFRVSFGTGPDRDLCNFYRNDPLGQTRIGRKDGIRFSCKLLSIEYKDRDIETATVLVSAKRLADTPNSSATGVQAQSIGAVREPQPLGISPVVSPARVTPAPVTASRTSSVGITIRASRTGGPGKPNDWIQGLPTQIAGGYLGARSAYYQAGNLMPMRSWLSAWKTTLAEPHRTLVELDFAAMLLQRKEKRPNAQQRLEIESNFREAQNIITSIKTRGVRVDQILGLTGQVEHGKDVIPFIGSH